MANRLSDTEIWKKDWFLDLNTKQKLLCKFLFDNCDCAGFYQISWNLIRLYFYDVEITREDFEQIKQVKFINENLIFIEDFALFQCKVKSFNDLNPKNKAHLGVLRLLKKYGIFDSPIEGASMGLERGTGIGIGKDIGNTINKQVDTINNNDDEKIKSLDPYMNPIRTLFIQEYQKVFNNTPRLAAFECQRLVELANTNDDIEELIPIALKRLKKIKWDQISYKPCANWLLKENNFERVINGEFEPQKSSYERLMEKYGGSNG